MAHTHSRFIASNNIYINGLTRFGGLDDVDMGVGVVDDGAADVAEGTSGASTGERGSGRRT